ncbi:MAG: nucleotidyltransferase domain-containing protein [Deltaproteobacteria bacterium]|jgi:predicted nucleotidyltransferase|nr:nucleotidyltransferase domain-containing protein [Deltaproteobacteria bacterium]
MNNKIFTLAEIQALVTPIAKRYGVDRMWIFGSYARGEATSKSDIDFRVDCDAIHGYFRFAGFYSDLEDVLAKRIDLLTTAQIDDDKFLENISKDEVMIYE